MQTVVAELEVAFAVKEGWMNVAGQIFVALLSLSDAAAVPAPAGWGPGPSGQFRFSAGGAPVYLLECKATEVVVTQFGVTQLVDLQANRPVGDTEGTALPPGAALMALATDRTDEPNMMPAAAVRNPDKGWDMTIRLAKDDPALLSLPRAKFISLFTTGFTRAAKLSKGEQKLLAAFMNRCRGKIPG
ncbi:MAG TPA: hypothetical protein VGB57_06765 [Allosphingosinicella sp.]|jgi:hypothetical protein